MLSYKKIQVVTEVLKALLKRRRTHRRTVFSVFFGVAQALRSLDYIFTWGDGQSTESSIEPM